MAKNRRKNPELVEDISQLTGAQKAAIFIISIGAKSASEMLKSLKESEVEEITMEIAKMRNVKNEVVDAVLKDFYQMMEAKQYILEGGLDYAEELLTELGGEGASEKMLKKLKSQSGTSVFDDFQDAKI